MGHRLFLPPPLCTGAVQTLSAEAGHYIARVLRLKPGARLLCFDGAGHEFDAELLPTTSKSIELMVGDLVRAQVAPPPILHLAMAWLKGQAMDTVAQKATELGISDLWPITAIRSNVKINRQRTTGRVEHWRKIAAHAAEQSERLFVPTVHEPVSLAEYLEANPSLAKVLFHPGHQPMAGELAYAPLALLIGPEGGWTTEEVAAATRQGAAIHGLGQRILRAETAPLVALACVHQLWGWR